MSEMLAAKGHTMIIGDLNLAGAQEVARGIVDNGGKAWPVMLDVTKSHEIYKFVADLKARGERVDVLINNAGLQHVSPIEQFDPAKWDLLLQVMLTAPFQLIQAALPGMYERNWGRIINVASVHGLIASPFKSAYVSAKHGVLGLTKTVALEAGARSNNITCNAICPSYVRTPLVEKQIADQAKVHRIPESEVVEKVMLTQNAIKKLIEPEEVAQLATFLCGEGAWSITGTAQTMDAGWLAH